MRDSVSSRQSPSRATRDEELVVPALFGAAFDVLADLRGDVARDGLLFFDVGATVHSPV
jgi:hypothetical protein